MKEHKVEPPLDARTLSELEQRGREGVRALLSHPGVQPAPHALVHLFVDGHANPTRNQVDQWLAHAEADRSQEGRRRHYQLLHLMWWTLFFAAVGAFASLAGAWPVIWPMLSLATGLQSG